jgi:glycosyltransferase involved in cell wall biosynthesis
MNTAAQLTPSTVTKTPNTCAYVLVTPARNEAAFIEKTLQAMVTQTVKPLRWVIASDGSTDGTNELVEKYAADHPWIELLKLPPRAERHFAGKVFAFNAGYERVKDLDYEVIGNLDGDSSFDAGYIEYLLQKFAENRRLGVAGTNYVEDAWDSSLKHDYRFANIEDVTGQCQLFRRECFEDIGGYKPNKKGGIDLIATLSARMHGWQTRVYTDKVLFHHRQQGTASANKFLVEFSNGQKDYMFGSHPLWQACRAVYRLTKKPRILGSCLLFAGYLWALLRRIDRTVSKDLMQFRRREQMQRLKGILARLFLRTNNK